MIRELRLPPDYSALLNDLNVWVWAPQHRAHRVVNTKALTMASGQVGRGGEVLPQRDLRLLTSRGVDPRSGPWC